MNKQGGLLSLVAYCVMLPLILCVWLLIGLGHVVTWADHQIGTDYPRWNLDAPCFGFRSGRELLCDGFFLAIVAFMWGSLYALVSCATWLWIQTHPL